MDNDVACNACGEILDEPRDQDPGERQPCPRCGSKTRKFFVTAQATINVESRLTVSATVASSVDIVSLLLQTVIVPAGKTSEGQLIEAVTEPWFEIIEVLKKDPAVAYQISDRKWEEIVAGAYQRAGFDEVILTPRSGDYGRDIIATIRGIGFIRVIDQVKAYKPGHLVTADDVRALIGVLHGDGASKGFLTTTSDFAPKLKDDPLIVPFMPSRLQLINGDQLLARLEELVMKKTSQA